MKLQDWLIIWLEQYKKNSIKQKTFFIYQNLIRLHINPILGHYEFEQITPTILQQYLNHKLEHGNLKNHSSLSINTTFTIFSILKQSFRLAMRLDYLHNDIFSLISMPKLKEKEIEAFTLEEQKRIESYCLHSNKPNYFGIVLCLYTGIRIGELLALTWDDIDFHRRFLYIRHTLITIKKGEKTITILDEPKTKKSKRIIPLPSTLISYLKSMKKNSSSPYIITTRSNQMVSIRSYQRTFMKLLIRAKIPYKNFHALRHTFATRAIELGMDVKTLSEILGHSNAMITLNRYAHSMLHYKTIMMDKLGKKLM